MSKEHVNLRKKINNGKLSVHFIGIAGKGLNGIAKYCQSRGYEVTGSDNGDSLEKIELRKKGIKIFDTHESKNIRSDCDVVVYSSVIKKTNPELLEAQRLNKIILKRSEFLGILMSYFKSISVAGSHGKSTTTALLGLALKAAQTDPVMFGGSFVKEIGSYEMNGDGELCVVEACEYDRSFYDLVGDISIITSVEKSHMEYYKTESNMIDAFKTFVGKHNKDSLVIINGDDVNARIVSNIAKCQVLTFGFNSSNDFVIKNVVYAEDGTVFDIYKNNQCILKKIKIKVPGFYNIYNFAATVVVMDYLGLDLSNLRLVAEEFSGVGRRFEIKRISDKTIFVDDFCHHPTQVKNLFLGLKQFFPDKKIIAIFQPRQFNLMKTFIKEYGKAFQSADKVLVTPIISALNDTKKDKKSLQSSDIIESIKTYSGTRDIVFVGSLEEAVNIIHKEKEENVVVTTIGAGDVYKVRDLYVRK